MKNRELAIEWLKRAKSNLLRSRQTRDHDEILLEDLAYDCQQCVEKSLKAICINNAIDFPLTHSISRLFDLLRENNVQLPENADDALFLTDYAVQTRYPGFYHPVDEEEFTEAYEIASTIFDWAEKMLLDKNKDE